MTTSEYVQQTQHSFNNSLKIWKPSETFSFQTFSKMHFWYVIGKFMQFSEFAIEMWKWNFKAENFDKT